MVAVQDGRVIGLGASRKLGLYVILRDVYGDVFTYAGLGSIARTYTQLEDSRRGLQRGRRRRQQGSHAEGSGERRHASR